MLTLDEAITHAKEKAKELRAEAETWSEYKLVSEKARNSMSDCLECANEHEQLAAWLEELKSYKDLFDSPKEAEEILQSICG